MFNNCGDQIRIRHYLAFHLCSSKFILIVMSNSFDIIVILGNYFLRNNRTSARDYGMDSVYIFLNMGISSKII